MKVLTVFVATYNERALEKFRAAGVRPQGKTLAFFEESEKTASMFFRLYTRNLYAIELSKSEFSLYSPNPTPPSSLGFLGDLDETQNLTLNIGRADGSI
ncbi:hypothetical protein HOU00_gp057 [Caulobacter phage CcrPW]|uniref:Uncharacterized protein n=1 Tax=Caulobacter phage CcrPW TaxID=2283271 RepID=A0A385EA35_9CAUD|nr:hypothetical protein HOU00_gp057 [Caulobacter phage CcrPW]AXQ68596.1 hypothetical protein CcrPW_gp057 [Caulobacter phage CcrPW]